MLEVAPYPPDYHSMIKDEASAQQIWEKMQPLTFRMMQHYYSMVEERGGILKNCEYDDWKDVKKGKNYICQGSKKVKTGKMHGVVRIVEQKTGDITESSYNKGLLCGLERHTHANGVTISLNQGGHKIAYFKLDENLNEIKRGGSSAAYLKDLSAKNFVKGWFTRASSPLPDDDSIRKI